MASQMHLNVPAALVELFSDRFQYLLPRDSCSRLAVRGVQSHSLAAWRHSAVATLQFAFVPLTRKAGCSSELYGLFATTCRTDLSVPEKHVL
jgi:hypothetical protein